MKWYEYYIWVSGELKSFMRLYTEIKLLDTHVSDVA